jgi:hypothetical protein
VNLDTNPEMQEHVFTRDPRTMTAEARQAVMNKKELNYDEELDNPLIHDPAIAKQLDELSRRYTTPTNQNIEMSLMEFEKSYHHEGTRRQRWAGQRRWMGKEAEEMRVVKLLHPYEFLRRLRRAGVDARAEEHREARLWLNPGTVVGRIGINARVCGVSQFITTIQYPYAPEYSVMRFNQYDVPTEEKYRGWRTTLLCLIVPDIITEEEAEKAFGPALGPASEFYREQLQIHRRIRMGLQI